MSDAQTVAALRTTCSNLDSALTKAIGWLEYGIPDKPDHDCGNPDSGCDTECMRWHDFCDDLANFKNLVGKDGGG